MAERSVKSLELDAADTVHHSKTAKHSRSTALNSCSTVSI